MNINCKVTISRNSDNAITIAITDEASRVQFVEVAMTPEAFAMAITGHGYMSAAGTVRGLQCVGKIKVDEDRTVAYTGEKTHDRAVMSAWLREHCQEDGWIIDDYLGSQRSVSYDAAGRAVLHYRVSRFVEQDA